MAFKVICEHCGDSINKITNEVGGNLLGYRMVECKHCHTQYKHYRYLLEIVFIVISSALTIILEYYNITDLWVNIFIFYILIRMFAIYLIPLKNKFDTAYLEE
ncbi:hypothetical protein DCO58_01480 [Helicobacter saguini]|uniref:Uncharacterized protein n=1 Tax=Helicobacter saguini TaxID=1548018 RepID=A0A347VRD2_9HELI|nr:hypothetical protein [Helicobacter saguini]MWV62944.1 hypothetical protein [Helicobacter saguini]MWV66385.1 hypothetical protein [Helicobacter saguini]MWV68739.1 hypothetical protein [Helicobacter saguini]MWV71710.1 hypothetical protein [Helicobacter saguini]TLD92155.1 hypothetical protein LS64_010715 [Helicobacter saguini]